MLSYVGIVKSSLRALLGVKPCPCGCNFVRTRRGAAVDWSELGPVARWATFDPDGE